MSQLASRASVAPLILVLERGEHAIFVSEIKEEGRTRCCYFCVCVCVFFYAQTTWTVRPGRWDQRGCACNLVTTDNSILYTPLPSDRVLTVDGKLLITVQNNPYSNTAGLSTTNWTSWSVNHKLNKLHTQSCMLFPCYVTVWICERNKYIYHAFFSRISFHGAAAEQNVTIKNKKVLFEKIRFVQ